MVSDAILPMVGFEVHETTLPAGAPATENDTLPAKPFSREIMTVYVTEPPGLVVPDVGFTSSEKSCAVDPVTVTLAVPLTAPLAAVTV
jgi:hypothetical protein